MTLLAEPNGAGKTTFARSVFTDELAKGQFLNADDIAQSLNAEDVDKAALAAGRAVVAVKRGGGFEVYDEVSWDRLCAACGDLNSPHPAGDHI